MKDLEKKIYKKLILNLYNKENNSNLKDFYVEKDILFFKWNDYLIRKTSLNTISKRNSKILELLNRLNTDINDFTR